MTTDEGRLLALLVPALRTRVLEDYQPDSCIASVRAFLDVARSFGLAYHPLVVEAFVGNARWWELAQAGQLAEAKADPAARSVGIGIVDGEAHAMHLVAYSASHLVDPSLDQAERLPLLPLGPGIFRLPPGASDSLRAGGPVSFIDDGSGVVVSYRPRPTNRDYTRSPNWGRRDAAKVARIVGDTVRLVRAQEVTA